MSGIENFGSTAVVRAMLADAQDAIVNAEAGDNDKVLYSIASSLFSIAESLAALTGAVVRWETSDDEDNLNTEVHVVTHRWTT